MIAIPNMEKPKSCSGCDWIAWSNLDQCNECDRRDGRPIPDNEEVADFCPLIEIVQCKDCKYGHKHILKDTYDCDKSDITVFHEADFFCKASERRE